MSSGLTREEIQQEALSRATTGQTLSNWPAIIEGFIAKGIPADQIEPRVNVFTYNAWRALGRQVRKGEHGVKVTTWIPCKAKEEARPECEGGELRKQQAGYRFPRTATVFHVSQTDPISE